MADGHCYNGAPTSVSATATRASPTWKRPTASATASWYYINVEPVFDKVRDDARFHNLLRRMKLE